MKADEFAGSNRQSEAGPLKANGASLGRSRQCGWRLWIKIVLDRSLAFCGLVIASPLILTVFVIIRLSMGRPALFRQLRPGRNAKPFTLFKFRTMSERRDGSGKLMTDAERLTPVGRVLRATSVDELPQLWNLLRGEISLVGPRPLLMSYLPRYSPKEARRHEVLPGITGWAQVNGRNTLSWEEKFELDIWYLEHWSLWLDLRILAETVRCVLLRRGISRDGHATMPEFTGSDEMLHRTGSMPEESTSTLVAIERGE